jgi:uncharacterized protein YcfL
MKKIVIAFVGLLLLVTLGCSNEDKKESTETSSEKTVIETQEKTDSATKEGAIEGQNQDTGTTGEAVQEPKKKPPIEGC